MADFSERPGIGVEVAEKGKKGVVGLEANLGLGGA